MCKILSIILLVVMFTSPSIAASNEESQYIQQGKVSHESGDYQKALKAFKKATAINPNSADAYAGLGMSYLRLGSNEVMTNVDILNNAKNAFNRALELNPDLADPHYGNGLVSILLSDIATANKEYNYLKLRNKKLAAALLDQINAYKMKEKATGSGCKITSQSISSLNFNPGNYEITNWIELPDGGSAMMEKNIEFLPSKEAIAFKQNKMDGCTLLSQDISNDMLSSELECGTSSGMMIISSSFKFSGNSFEGTMHYKSAQGFMKVGMRGKRIGDTPESKPPPTPAKKLDEIDMILRKKWDTMIFYLVDGNFDKALELFHPLQRQKQSEYFKALRNEWPKMVKEIVEFRREEINDDRGYAKYELVTKENGKKFSYEVLFGKDQYGNWFIVDF